jgi:regulator of protease activity HflC (stomatin/prohibitin superfamily)
MKGRMAEEDEMGIFIFCSIIAAVGMLAAGIVILFFKEGQVEVGPNRSIVYKNLWTGEAKALGKGLWILIPGVYKKIVEVTLENETSDPQKCTVITGDGVSIDLDYVIYTQKVVEPVKVATEINYEKRRDLILNRIKAYIQDQTTKYSTEDIVIKEGLKTKIKKDLLDEIERAVNQSLTSEVESPWGIKTEIQIQSMDLPEKLKEVVEEAATAEKEGERIRVKAEKAGVPSWLVALGDIVYDVFRTSKGGKK